MGLGCAFCKYKELSIIYGVYRCRKHCTLVNYNDKGCDDFDKE